MIPYIPNPDAVCLYYIPLSMDLSLGGGVLHQIYGNPAQELNASRSIPSELLEAKIPQFTVNQLKDCVEFLLKAKRLNLIEAYHDISDGGLVTALLEMSFASHCGLEIYLDAFDAWEGSAHQILFSEMPGVLCAISRSNIEDFESLLAENSSIPYVMCATPLKKESISFWDRRLDSEKAILNLDRCELHRMWSLLSCQMKSMRDDKDCAQEELDLKCASTPGFSESLLFDYQSIVVAKGVKPKVAILREQGINGQNEMAAAFEAVGFVPIDVTMTDLLQDNDFSNIQMLAVCGGFSYGDVLGAGAGWAQSILNSEKLSQKFLDFFDASDTLALGVCNGCQMLSRIKSLIPGFDHCPEFLKNRSNQFESRVVMLECDKENNSILFDQMGGSVLGVASAHGEGRAVFSSSDERYVVARYVDMDHKVTEKYPLNPNGSEAGVAAVSNESGESCGNDASSREGF